MKRCLLLFCLFLAACDGLLSGNETPVPTISDIPTAAPTTISADAAPLTDLTEANNVKFDLRIWLSLEIAQSSDERANELLANQLNEFNNSHPDIELFVEQKTISDQGGSLSYLRTGRNVAPSALPDVIALPAADLVTAVEEGLVFPIDSIIDEGGLYPAAIDLGTVDGTLYGLPFALTEMRHLVYNSTAITQPFPARWDNLIDEEGNRMMFAAAGNDATSLILQLYNDENGSFEQQEGKFNFDGNALSAGLDQIRLANENGLFVDQVSQTTDEADSWQVYLRGDANIVMVSTEFYLEEQISGPRNEFVGIPGRNEAMAPMVSGWVWAVTTPDPARQALSAELIQWLNTASNLGAWSALTGQLPSRPAAFSSWPTNPYSEFLQQELDRAQAIPNRLDSIGRNALINAVVSLINQPIDAATAAGQVIDMLDE